MQRSKIIAIVGFRGTGLSYSEYAEENPLIHYGHVGVQFEEDSIVYGFHPTNKIVRSLGGIERFRDRMVGRIPVPGSIQDDRGIFTTAYNLSINRSDEFKLREPDRLVVYTIGIRYPIDKYTPIREHVKLCYSDQTSFPYLFSPITRDDPFDNCATVWRQFGMEIPEFAFHEGSMTKYVALIAENGGLWLPT
jgi:hypothetical protein